MRIDLHVHSTASDGTQSPTELMAVAVAAGLDVIALTDHDTTTGWAEAQRARPPGLTVVPGVELSCQSTAVEGPPIGVHLLGYLLDPAHPGFMAEAERLRTDRLSRGRRMAEAMADDGLPVSWEQVDRIAAGAPVGRPHLGRALVEAGLVATVTEAFARYLHRSGPYYRPKRSTDIHAGIALIRAAGGVPVLAHGRARLRGRVLDDAVIAACAGTGLAGLEVDHPDHPPADRDQLRALAADLGLLVTGSSDYHGANKLTPIGACVTDPDVYAALVGLSTGTAPYTD